MNVKLNDQSAELPLYLVSGDAQPLFWKGMVYVNKVELAGNKDCTKGMG